MSEPGKLGRPAGIALGLALSVTPFMRYRWTAPHPTAHADHAPRHGGVLGMVGDRHLEITRAGGRIECHLSDIYRRPLDVAGGHVECADGGVVAATADGCVLVAEDRCAAPEITCHVLLAGDAVVRMTASVPAPPSDVP